MVVMWTVKKNVRILHNICRCVKMFDKLNHFRYKQRHLKKMESWKINLLTGYNEWIEKCGIRKTSATSTVLLSRGHICKVWEPADSSLGSRTCERHHGYFERPVKTDGLSNLVLEVSAALVSWRLTESRWLQTSSADLVFLQMKSRSALGVEIWQQA